MEKSPQPLKGFKMKTWLTLLKLVVLAVVSWGKEEGRNGEGPRGDKLLDLILPDPQSVIHVRLENFYYSYYRKTNSIIFLSPTNALFKDVCRLLLWRLDPVLLQLLTFSAP